MTPPALLVVAVLWLAGSGVVAQAPAPAPAASFNGTYPSDVSALYSLRASLEGLPSDWTVNADPCGAPACGPMLSTRCPWSGLACNDSRVVAVWLPCLREWCLNLHGTLPAELAQASQLQYLEFQGNSIGGSLPPQWASLSQLAVLSAGYNDLTGTLPPEYGNLTALQHVRLSANRLGGALPSRWGRLGEVRELLLGSNQLTGGFPPEWATLGSVQVLVFEDNGLSGSLPSVWSRMLSLQVLDVRGMCAVCGPVPFNQAVRLGITGSSLGWPCSSSNCSSLPLGFLGQAVIISAILLVLLTLCLWRRVWLFRRHGAAGQRSGLGLMRAAVTSRAPRPPRAGAHAPDDEEARPVPPAPPPVVVLQPDLQFCTARMDAEWAAALAAANVDPSAPPKDAQTPESQPRGPLAWLGYLRGQRGVRQQPEAGAGSGGSSPTVPQSVELAAAQQAQQAPPARPSSSDAGSESGASGSLAQAPVEQQRPLPSLSPVLLPAPAAQQFLPTSGGGAVQEPAVASPSPSSSGGRASRRQSTAAVTEGQDPSLVGTLRIQREFVGHNPRDQALQPGDSQRERRHSSRAAEREARRRPIPMYDVDLLAEPLPAMSAVPTPTPQPYQQGALPQVAPPMAAGEAAPRQQEAPVRSQEEQRWPEPADIRGPGLSDVGAGGSGGAVR